MVKGRAFDSWRRIGSAVQAVKVYNMRMVDELIFLDISATLEKRQPDFELIDDLADDCFMPLTVGGGVTKLDDVKNLLRVGADKVAINTAAVEKPDLIGQISDTFGSQCIVVSIDVKRNLDNNKYEVYSRSGTKSTGKDPVDHAINVERLGAGEILLTVINNDGMMSGYDLDVTRRVGEETSIPIIASGGAGNYAHMLDVAELPGVGAVAAASMFHFTEQTPVDAKKYLRKAGLSVRLL